MDFLQSSLGIELLIDLIGALDFAHIGVCLRIGNGVQRLPVVGIVPALEPLRHVAHPSVIGGQGHIQAAVLV